MYAKPLAVLRIIVLALALASHARAGVPGSAPASGAQPLAPDAVQPLFTVEDSALKRPPVFVVYGDMRFTDPTETTASNPGARRALVARVAGEHPDALILTGDLAWHGGEMQDFEIFRQETTLWRGMQLHVFPVLGNHEFSRCEEAQCLQNWWQTFPELREHRWYSVALGSRIRVLVLDSNTSLLPASAQARWLEQSVRALPPEVSFVLFALHHPPVADESFFIVRRNERAFGTLIERLAQGSRARFVVCAGHVHNYERFEKQGITYLISGGGGAKPLSVRRGPDDLYRSTAFPNYHYLRFELQGDALAVRMVRLEDPDTAAPHEWRVADEFTVPAK